MTVDEGRWTESHVFVVGLSFFARQQWGKAPVSRQSMKNYMYLVSVLSLAVMLVACATPGPTATPTAAGIRSSGPTGADVPALHKTWQWQKRIILDSGEEVQIDDPSRYTLTFKADGTYEFQADCNKGSGSYVADEKGAIRMEAGPVTLGECSEGSRYQEVMNMMYAVQDYRLEEDGATLVLVWPAGGPEDYFR
jgi:heat shock protein HslJ